jgi:hypothetical protein
MASAQAGSAWGHHAGPCRPDVCGGVNRPRAKAGPSCSGRQAEATGTSWCCCGCVSGDIGHKLAQHATWLCWA